MKHKKYHVFHKNIIIIHCQILTVLNIDNNKKCFLLSKSSY